MSVKILGFPKFDSVALVSLSIDQLKGMEARFQYTRENTNEAYGSVLVSGTANMFGPDVMDKLEAFIKAAETEVAAKIFPLTAVKETIHDSQPSGLTQEDEDAPQL